MIEEDINQFIVPLDINGLTGRMLRAPALTSKGEKKEILMVYGHHASIERVEGIVQVLRQFGNVTMPDLPGFGGMESFYHLGKKPTLDNLADYLASFIKLRYKHRTLTIVGMSLGFVIATRMLQRYPALNKKVDIVVSLVGFADSEDFNLSSKRHNAFYYGSKLLSVWPMYHLFRLCLQPAILRFVYGKTGHRKFVDLGAKESSKMVEAEILLWRINDVRTWLFTTTQFMRFTNCNQQVAVPVWHVGVDGDHFFDNNRVEQHLKIIFPEVKISLIKMRKHAPTVVASAEEAAPFIPYQLRRRLAKQ